MRLVGIGSRKAKNGIFCKHFMQIHLQSINLEFPCYFNKIMRPMYERKSVYKHPFVDAIALLCISLFFSKKKTGNQFDEH